MKIEKTEDCGMTYVKKREIIARRDAFFEAARKGLSSLMNPDGSGRIPQFNPPMREPVWILPALFHGSEEDIALANRITERYNDPRYGGKSYNVFQSNLFAGLLAEYDALLTPAAREVMRWHTEQVFRTYEGSAQSDLKFHGCNDNMPMMSTKALILGGGKCGNEKAFRHGVWNLNEFRRLLSRSAWESEFNSSTYSAITLSNLAKIAAYAGDDAVRKLAEQCEIRLWTELLLHWHPGTKHSGGPQCRAYAIDAAGHNHSLQALFWLVFGPELTGRDLMKSYFEPDGTEVVHFQGNYMQSVAEYCDLMDNEFHLPEELASLIEQRKYPALTRGRSECMCSTRGECGEYHTCSYMEEDFSLGTVNIPLCSGDSTLQLYATYRRTPEVRSFRDAATVFYRYADSPLSAGIMESSADGAYRNEQFVKSLAHAYAIQKNNTALLTTIPAIELLKGKKVGILKLDVLFPAHYGKITASVIGKNHVQSGACGESSEVQPVSIETGEVFIHIQPLLPTSLARKAAVRFRKMNHYEALELINYEGPERAFSAEELEYIQNGFVFTIDSRSKYESLEAFHREKSDALVLDYTLASHRFLRYKRKDVQFEICYTPLHFGVQTHAIDGRTEPWPILETNQLDVAKLPFMRGEVEADIPFFPWGDSLKQHNYPDLKWMIGSRGLPGEAPYSRIRSG